MNILILSDIHANFPALQAVANTLPPASFNTIINCGDTTVYGPFPNETIKWLQTYNVLSILGNTDRKVVKLVQGKSFSKPSKYEKRIMYTWTAEHLNQNSIEYIRSLKKKQKITVRLQLKNKTLKKKIGIFHGSPSNPNEFLFDTTPDTRFEALAQKHPKLSFVVCGHSHTPFHKEIGDTHFINPGSVGRMFDGNPAASCCTLKITTNSIAVTHYRIPYETNLTISELRNNKLPEIYCEMYKLGRKLN